MRKLAFTLIVTGIWLVFPQECKSEDSVLIHVDTLIYNGWLILYGKLIERPYHFSFGNDTFWINELQFLPAPPDPLQKPPEWIAEYTELGKWYFRTIEFFADSCRTKYNRWRRKYSAAVAMDSLLHWIGTQDLVKIKSVEPFGCAIKITYGYRHLDLISNPTPHLTELMSKPEDEYVTIHYSFDQAADVDTALAQLTQNEALLKECKNIIGKLKENSFLIVARGRMREVGGVRGREIMFINSIKGILSKSISKSQMLYELRTQTEIDSLDAEYIILNRDTWIEGQ